MNTNENLEKLLLDGYTITMSLTKGNLKIVAETEKVPFRREQNGLNIEKGIKDLKKDIYGK